MAKSKVLPVTHSDQLVECAEQLKGIAQYLPLVQTLANAGDDLGEKMKRINVLEDVGLAVGDEDHVQFVKGLVHEADVVLFDCCVLGATVGELGQRSKKTFDSRPLHISELAGEDGLAASGAYGSC